MTTQAAQSTATRIHAARAHAARHRLAEAEDVYREVLRTQPDTPEALNFVAMCALARGEFTSAQRDLEHAAQLDPTEPEIWKNLGIAHLAQRHGGDALDAFDRALGLEPMHFAARLHRGAALEQLQRIDDATAAYFGALAAAQGHGKWRNDVTTPPDLRPAVRHAIAFVDQHLKRLFMGVLQPLRARYGTASLARIEAGLDIYLGERPADHPDARQACRFFYVPGLAPQPYFPRERFAWQPELERHAAAIRAELRAVLDDPVGAEPFPGADAGAQAQAAAAGGSRERAWSVFFLHRHGEACERNLQRCPRTAAALAALPLVHIAGRAPQVLFSMLAPGAHVTPRQGITNALLVTQLPVIVHGDCGIRVGGVEQALHEGRCVTFDGTFEHEAWNRSGGICGMLVVDTWHPELDEAERAAIALLFGGIDAFSRAAKVDRPPID